jgi:hypothetical protein
MEKTHKVTVSLALTLLLCFFLPWVQVSCGSEKDTLSGLDLARDGERGLWLIPLLALVLVVCGLRLLKIDQRIYSLIALISGAVSVYLMNHERTRYMDSGGLVEAKLTLGFWLGLITAIGLIVRGFWMLLRRPRSP